jgi:hypothetical protein
MEKIMVRLFGLGLVSLLVVTQAQAADALTGVWRQETEDLGVSYWEFTPKGKNTYAVQEYGLGGVTGTAHLRDGVLVIDFKNDDLRGAYEWKLTGIKGKGKLTIKKEGEDDKVYEKSSIRFIGK